MVLAISLILIAVATVMLLGWGWAFQRIFRLERMSWPATVVLGMGAIVFVGGILNLLRLAYPAALLAIVGIGIILGVMALRGGISQERPPIVILLLVAAILIFTIVTQLPPSLYNFHDDFQKYFAYPVRMVETGTVFGSPLSAMGLQTLGAQAFLDGFVVAFFPIKYINGIDAVFGLFLCLILAAQNRLPAMSAICVLGVFFINPQYVNISTLYCGSALIMAIVLTSVESSAALGLLYAALIAMKPIFAVFVAIHFLAIALMASGGIRAGVRWAVRTGLAAAMFLLPWALLHAPNYLAGLRLPSPVHINPAPPNGLDRIDLFSFAPLEYGSTAANYTLLIAAIAICGVICWRVKPAALPMVACCATGVISFFVFVYFLGPMHYGYNHGLRYYTTVAIGLAPAVFGFTAWHSRASRVWLPMIVAAIPLAAFGPSVRDRTITALKDHTGASYSWLLHDADYVEYNHEIFTAAGRQAVSDLQAHVPPGESILAWINTPFYFDYRRNHIIDIDTAGIGTRWATIPEARYLIWDYAGYATPDQGDYEDRKLHVGANERRDALVTLDFIHHLDAIVEKGEVLFDDGEIKVVRLKVNARVTTYK